MHCIEPLVKGKQVSCPTCRKYTSRRDICKDFNTAQLVQLLREEKVDSQPGKGQTRCDICQDPDSYATNFCQVCEDMMCHECTRAHCGSKATRYHKVKTLDDIIEDTKSKIISSIKTLNKQKKELGKRHTDIESIISTIRSEQEKTCVVLKLTLTLTL
jgi:ribosomal protein S14